jgi:DNA-binding GntR family transcriptional regulator
MNAPDRAGQDFAGIARVSVPTLVDAAVLELRKLILSGQLKPGEHLVEERLTDRLGISRAPVREALNVLQGEGIVEKLDRRGFMVVAMTSKDVQEIYSLRMALERLAVELGVPVTETDRLVPMKQALENMREAATQGNDEGVLAANSAFHRGLVGLASHERLERTYESMQIQLHLCMAYNLKLRQRLYSDPQDSVVRHRALLDKVIEGDREAVLHDLKHHGAASFLDHLDELLSASD